MGIRRPTRGQIREAADALGMTFDDDELASYHDIIVGAMSIYDTLEGMPDNIPEVRYPRTGGRRPSAGENRHGAWYYKTEIKGQATGKLAGKRVVLKDTICLAGVPMMDGASALEGYVPDVDAEVVNRILEAGGEIAGKAVCEYFSYSGGSHTASTGPVHNPHKQGYAAGGSSSGCAVLVSTGEVDMAVGGDQAGSIRTPASHSGIVGLKPTYGLVPYTGILSSEYNVDHAGPMTRSIADNALLLEVLAGEDGVDMRQRNVKPAPYVAALQQGAKGLKVAVVPEAFGWPQGQSGVDDKVRAGARHLASLGMTVDEVSIPLHRRAWHVWIAFGFEGYYRNMVLGGGMGFSHGGLFVTSLMDRLRNWKEHTNDFPPGLKLGSLVGHYMGQQYGGHYYAKAMNVARRLRATYDAVLADYDMLLMPTTRRTAEPLPGPGASVGERAKRTPTGEAAPLGYMENTCPFDLTHHPALSIPCGMLEGLPVGMMLIGRHFDEATLYRAGHAFEQAFDWKSL